MDDMTNPSAAMEIFAVIGFITVAFFVMLFGSKMVLDFLDRGVFAIHRHKIKKLEEENSDLKRTLYKYRIKEKDEK